MQVRRRWFAAGAVGLAVAVAVVVVTLPDDNHLRRSAVLAQESPTPDESATLEPTASPSASPQASPSLSPTPARSPSDPSTAPSDGDRGGVVPTASGPASDPVTTSPPPVPDVQLAASTTSLPTATKLSIHVRWRDVPGERVFVRLSTGDGAQNHELNYGCYGTRYPVTHAGGWSSTTVPWSYRRAGSYRVTAARWIDPCGGKKARQLDSPSTLIVHVRQGANVANGPWEPHLDLAAHPTDGDPHSAMIEVDSWDEDGWGWRYVFDFGDGSEPYDDAIPFQECPSPVFPDTTWTTGGHGGSGLRHTFPSAGTYIVRLTFTSSNCDGGDVQTVTRTATVTVT